MLKTSIFASFMNYKGDTSLLSVLTCIRDGRYEASVSALRSLLDEERTDEAERLKKTAARLYRLRHLLRKAANNLSDSLSPAGGARFGQAAGGTNRTAPQADRTGALYRRLLPQSERKRIEGNRLCRR